MKAFIAVLFVIVMTFFLMGVGILNAAVFPGQPFIEQYVFLVNPPAQHCIGATLRDKESGLIKKGNAYIVVLRFTCDGRT